MTIPSPSNMHFRGGRDAIDQKAYPDMAEFYADLARVYQRGGAAISPPPAAAICRSTRSISPISAIPSCASRCEHRRGPGDPAADLCQADQRRRSPAGPRTWSSACISAAATSKAPGSPRAAMTRWPRCCSTRSTSTAISSNMTARAPGDFAPLRFVPKGKTVVLGLVTTQAAGKLETKDELKRRIDEAAKYCAARPARAIAAMRLLQHGRGQQDHRRRRDKRSSASSSRRRARSGARPSSSCVSVTAANALQ